MPIHANWQDDSLLLWCLRDDDASGIDELRDRVGEITSDALLASVAQAATISLWLPRDGALAARELPALKLSPADAIDLLLSLPHPPPDTCGESIRYWRELAHFVVGCIHHQLFFPAIAHDGATYAAAWRLAPLPLEDLAKLERFAASMPPSCRALSNGPTDPLALIESFLASTADALIRRAAANDPFFARVHALASENAPAELRWLSALLREDPRIHGHIGELANQLAEWSASLEEPSEADAWTLGFTLIEPPNNADADAPWRVTFQLLSSEGNALELANDALRTRKAMERRLRLSDELRRAAEIFPALARIVDDPSPTDIELSTAEAYEFLRRHAIELRQRDFTVTLPRWAEDEQSQLGLVMNVSPTSASNALGLDSILAFNWRVAVGGEELSPEQFDELVRRQVPLVRFSGRWMRIDPDEARAAADVLRREAAGELTLGQAIRAAYGMQRAQAGVRFLGLRGSDWIRDLLEQSPAQRLVSLKQPENFIGTLRAYQLRGLEWLAFLARLGIGGCLADDMGLGKTIQFIALLLHERTSSEKPGSTLLFAPTSVVGNWVREIEKFAPSLRVLLHHGPQRLTGDSFTRASREHDLIITSYALAHRDLSELQRVPWHRIALDEAQKIKNPSAASSIAIRNLSAPHRVALTGTPIENHLSELWSIMDMLNPGLLGTAGEFRERFAVPVERLADQQRASQLRQMIRPFVLRRTKADPEIAGDLPEKMENNVYCTLTAEQAAMYQRITTQMLGEIDAATGIRRRGLVLAVLTRLKQICDHPALLRTSPSPGTPGEGRREGDFRGVESLDDRSGKCERLIEMLEEVLEEGEAALVFTQYREMGNLLEKMLIERLRTPVLFLHGGTPQKRRDELVQKFQSPGSDARIFLLSLRAGGLGLNLTAANHVFHFDRWWNPAVEAQATDRAHRIGQSRTVQVHKFVCIGTVEERIDRMLAGKMQLADAIVGAGDEWLTNLSTSELAEYLKLSEAAIGEF